MSGEGFSLKKRMFRARTLISFIIALIILYFIFRNMDLKKTWEIFLKVNLLLLLVAFLIHYLSYPIRGIRWGVLLKKMGVKAKAIALTEISFLGQFVNCIVPAKLGDIYGGYLIKKNYGGTTSQSVGTLFVTRVLDLVVLAIMLCFAVLLIFGFGKDTPRDITLSIIISVIIGLLALLFIFLLRRKKQWFIRLAPTKIKSIIANFEIGVSTLSKRLLPKLVFLTIIIWLLEAGRFYFVSWSLGFKMSFALAIFTALAASLITSLPITPSGLGAVEAAIVGILLLANVDKNLAFSIAIMDRIIGYWSQLLVGLVVYSVSKKV